MRISPNPYCTSSFRASFNFSSSKADLIMKNQQQGICKGSYLYPICTYKYPDDFKNPKIIQEEMNCNHYLADIQTNAEDPCLNLELHPKRLGARSEPETMKETVCRLLDTLHQLLSITHWILKFILYNNMNFKKWAVTKDFQEITAGTKQQLKADICLLFGMPNSV